MAHEHPVANAAAVVAAAAAAVNNEWDAAEEMLLNPHQAAMDQGYEEGRAAGLQTGFEEGKKTGQANAKEIGVQLGFILGCCEVVKAHIMRRREAEATTKSEGKNDETSGVANEGSEGSCTSKAKAREARILQTVDVLFTLIEDFPRPDQLFGTANQKVAADKQQQQDDDDDVQEVGFQSIDVNPSLQEIKAKFKLLTVQLKMPGFSLKNLLQQSQLEASSTANAGNKATATQEINDAGKSNKNVPVVGIADW